MDTIIEKSHGDISIADMQDEQINNSHLPKRHQLVAFIWKGEERMIMTGEELTNLAEAWLDYLNGKAREMKTQTDRERYDELVGDIAECQRIGRVCFTQWREIEAIKNRHGGKIPPADSDVTAKNTTVN